MKFGWSLNSFLTMLSRYYYEMKRTNGRVKKTNENTKLYVIILIHISNYCISFKVV